MRLPMQSHSMIGHSSESSPSFTSTPERVARLADQWQTTVPTSRYAVEIERLSTQDCAPHDHISALTQRRTEWLPTPLSPQQQSLQQRTNHTSPTRAPNTVRHATRSSPKKSN